MSHHRQGGLAVPDASAVVVLLIDPSTRGDTVAQLLRGATLFAPSLLPYEVANVLRRRRAAGLLSDGEARIAFDALRRLPVELWPFEVLAARAWELGPNLSTYDAAYVALAEHLDATLVTTDARLARAPGIRCAIELVA